MTRRAARVDANHADVSRALTKCGAWVIDCSRVGEGFPDLIAVVRKKVLMIEVKDGSKPPSARKLTPLQVEFHARAAVNGVPVYVVESVDQAIELIGSLGVKP
jgi:Holliday junction resolvase